MGKEKKERTSSPTPKKEKKDKKKKEKERSPAKSVKKDSKKDKHVEGNEKKRKDQSEKTDQEKHKSDNRKNLDKVDEPKQREKRDQSNEKQDRKKSKLREREQSPDKVQGDKKKDKLDKEPKNKDKQDEDTKDKESRKILKQKQKDLGKQLESQQKVELQFDINIEKETEKVKQQDLPEQLISNNDAKDQNDMANNQIIAKANIIENVKVDDNEKHKSKEKKIEEIEKKKEKDVGKQKDPSKDKTTTKEKDKERDKQRDNDRERQKDRERGRQKDKYKDKEKYRERDKRREKDIVRESKRDESQKKRHPEKDVDKTDQDYGKEQNIDPVKDFIEKEPKVGKDVEISNLPVAVDELQKEVNPEKQYPADDNNGDRNSENRREDYVKKDYGRNKQHNNKQNFRQRGNNYNRYQNEDRQQNRNRSRSRGQSKAQEEPTLPQTEEQIVKEAERKRRLRLARARLIKYEQSDEEQNKYKKAVYHEEQPRSKLDNYLLEGDQFTEAQKQRVRQREERKMQEKCRQLGKKLLLDSDGLEGDGEEEDNAQTVKQKFVSDDEEDVQQLKPKRMKSLLKLRQLKAQAKQREQGPARQVEEEDPLEAFMKSMESQAVKQEPLDNVVDSGLQVITLADILHQAGQATNQDLLDEEADDRFHQLFLKSIKQKEAVDRQRMEEEENDQLEEQLDPDLEVEEEGNDFLSRQKKLMEKKELKAVDHSKIDYIIFRKNLYHEVPEIKKMGDDQVEQVRQSMGNIKVRGKDIPRPILNWYQCGLNDRILSVLMDKFKFEKPYPIQAQSISCIMSGRDFIGIAETGSGKTLGYLLPMIRHILDQPALKEGDGPLGLIMAPTRELAHQIFVDCKSFCSAINLNVVCCVGGAGIAGQLSGLKRGAEVVVCTPGRMIDVLTTSNGKVTNLRRVTYVVIDEADRMFDLGFEPQIYRILNNIRPDKQLVMFSATFPKNVEMLAKKTLDRPIECIVGGRGQAGSNIKQIIEFMEDHERLYQLLMILQKWQDQGSILIFVDKQSEADALFKELIRYGYRCLLLHGGLDSQDREFTIHDFKKGIKTIMVATSICARGLDIKSIVLVINFQCPNHMEDYIHRIGRTGRAGNTGTSITFFTPQDEQYAGDLITAQEKSQQSVPQKLRDYWKSFNEKVTKGEAKLFHNRNRAGQGYKFNEEEKEKVRTTRAAIRKQLGHEASVIEEDSTDDDEFFSKIIKVKQMSEEDRKKLKEEKEKAERERVMELIKDTNLKAQILSEATKAANACINAGGSREQVNQTAIDAIKKVLKNYLSTNRSVEGGIEEAMQIINEFEERERVANEFVSYDFEINDYPSHARSKVSNQLYFKIKICSRDFLDMIRELTNCTILQRGVYVEPAKKIVAGQRKQFLRIEGESEFFVLSAYKEIKRVAEDMAIRQMQQQLQGKFTI